MIGKLGKLFKAGAVNYGSTSIIVAEARALKDGVHAAIQAGYKRLLIEGDNSTLIQALVDKKPCSLEDRHNYRRHSNMVKS